MRLRIRYGKYQSVDDPAVSRRLERVVDDALGFRDDRAYWTYLALRYPEAYERYGVVDPQHQVEPTLEGLRRATTALQRTLDEVHPDVAARTGDDVDSAIRAFWLPTAEERRAPDDLRATFVAAALQAADGVLSSDLAPALARVRRLPGGEIEISDGPALAALSLQELLRKGPVSSAPCGLCGALWLPGRGAEFCKRPASGHAASCQAVALHVRFRERNGAYHRERRRLYERTRRARQSIARADYEEWLAENGPQDWQPFEAWKLAKQGK
jgi:hypothetical protein